MNWNATQSRTESVAYINKNVDMDDAKTAELANGMLKAVKEMMQDMKGKDLLFKEEVNGTIKTAKAVVKVTPALDTEKGEQVIVNGKKQMSYPQKTNSAGEPVYNTNATIYKGTESLTIFGSQKVNEETGKVELTSMRWANYNRNNPKASPSAKGNADIQASNASPELKALANAIENGEYLRDLDVVYSEKKIDRSDENAVAVGKAMKHAVKPIVQDMKEKHIMPELTSQNGNTYYGKAFVEVQPRMEKDNPDKQAVNSDGKPLYWVKAGIRKENDTLYLIGGSSIKEDGTVPIYGMQFQHYNENSPVDSIRVSQDDIQASSDVPNEFKRLAQAIEDGGYIAEINHSELHNLAYKLNTEVFKTKIAVEIEGEDGTKKTEVKKLVNANYSPETEREDGQGKWAEQITLFNKAEPEVVIGFSESEKYGHTARAINTSLTQVEVGQTPNGEPMYDIVEKKNKDDKSASFFLNSPEDVANFCPNIPELHEAVAEWTGMDIEQIRDAIENLGIEPLKIENIIEESGTGVKADDKADTKATATGGFNSFDDGSDGFDGFDSDGFANGQINDFDGFEEIFEEIDNCDVPF